MKILDVPQSGSLAGQTSSRNRYGQYRRTRAVPVNPNTDAQILARGRLADLSENWRALSPETREAWTLAGALVQKTDSLGQTYNLTGLQHYVGTQSVLAATGQAAVTNPPVGEKPNPPVVTVEASGADELSVEVASTADKVMLFSSPPTSPGRSFNKDFRLIGVATPSEGTATFALAAFTAKFGTLIAGQKLFLQAFAVDSTGMKSSPGAIEQVLE